MLRPIRFQVFALLLALPLATACEEEKKADAPAPTEATPTDDKEAPADDKKPTDADKPDPVAPTPPPTTTPTTPAAGPVKGDSCVDPCLRLVNESYNELVASPAFEDTEGLCKPCTGGAKKTCEAQKVDCSSFDYYRNCIYAAHGYAFKKAKWQKVFEKKPWYKKDPTFSESKLSRVASENIAILKWEGRGCGASVNYDELKKGKPVDLSVDLDGDGKKDSISVTPSSITVNGKDSGKLAFAIGEVAVIDIKKGDKRKELLVRAYESEDYYEHLVATYKKGALSVTKKSIGSGGLETPGDGRLVSRSMNCGQRYWSEYELSGTTVKEIKKPTLGKMVEGACAACPYVYVDIDGVERYVGEILRNIRRPELATTQSLDLSRLHGDIGSRVTLREKKDEITYLDELYVTTASGQVRPTICEQAGSVPAYCVKDGRAYVMKRGDELAVDFDLGGEAIEEVWATGYYVPVLEN